MFDEERLFHHFTAFSIRSSRKPIVKSPHELGSRKGTKDTKETKASGNPRSPEAGKDGEGQWGGGG